MKRLALLIAILVCLAVPVVANAGMYMGGWSAFMVMTDHLTQGKMQDLNSKPNWVVTKGEHWYTDVHYVNDANGSVRWNFVAHGGDFTYHYWMDCSFRNRKIDCGGPGGGPDWHRENWG